MGDMPYLWAVRHGGFQAFLGLNVYFYSIICSFFKKSVTFCEKLTHSVDRLGLFWYT